MHNLEFKARCVASHGMAPLRWRKMKSARERELLSSQLAGNSDEDAGSPTAAASDVRNTVAGHAA